jgi:hypothetical protein
MQTVQNAEIQDVQAAKCTDGWMGIKYDDYLAVVSQETCRPTDRTQGKGAFTARR